VNEVVEDERRRRLRPWRTRSSRAREGRMITSTMEDEDERRCQLRPWRTRTTYAGPVAVTTAWRMSGGGGDGSSLEDEWWQQAGEGRRERRAQGAATMGSGDLAIWIGGGLAVDIWSAQAQQVLSWSATGRKQGSRARLFSLFEIF
jgi:hypothetical protein